MGLPDGTSPTSFLLNYITKVWKKADFLNGGDACRVTFDETSRLASICTRGYWYGFDEVRIRPLGVDRVPPASFSLNPGFVDRRKVRFVIGVVRHQTYTIETRCKTP